MMNDAYFAVYMGFVNKNNIFFSILLLSWIIIMIVGFIIILEINRIYTNISSSILITATSGR